MRTDVEKVSERLGLFLGAAIFGFGFLNLFDPFHSWFEVQVANSGLPAPFLGPDTPTCWTLELDLRPGTERF